MSRGLAILLLVIALSPTVARAQAADTVTIRVAQGDSLDMLASEFYGDRKLALFIMVENKIQHPRPLRPYERLRVPINREITTAPGDTFQSLAESLLGDPRRSEFLAELNGMSPDYNLAAGTPLILPFAITHVAAGPESLVSLAKNYYDKPKYADILRRYNFLDKTALEKGESILVPSYNVRVHPSKYPPIDAESKARREKRRASSELAANAIPSARHAWRTGDYATVKQLLAEIDGAYLELGPAIEVDLLLGCAQIAFDETEPALATFRHIIDRKPGYALRKLDHSPKILAVWTKAGGLVE
ncbi:MAG: Peptidoglycan-binding lysin domain protein [Deltaproteobacteria bacterium]|nr:Peptidoglycan-binding lysin domain protein [Deltaproteobacteria bacterium]